MFFTKDKNGKIEVDTEKEKLIELIDSLRVRIETLEKGNSVLLEQINKLILDNTGSHQFNSRIEDLELWRAKLHQLMVEKTPIKKTEKLTKFGSILLRQ